MSYLCSKSQNSSQKHDDWGLPVSAESFSDVLYVIAEPRLTNLFPALFNDRIRFFLKNHWNCDLHKMFENHLEKFQKWWCLAFRLHAATSTVGTLHEGDRQISSGCRDIAIQSWIGQCLVVWCRSTIEARHVSWSSNFVPVYFANQERSRFALPGGYTRYACLLAGKRTATFVFGNRREVFQPFWQLKLWAPKFEERT